MGENREVVAIDMSRIGLEDNNIETCPPYARGESTLREEERDVTVSQRQRQCCLRAGSDGACLELALHGHAKLCEWRHTKGAPATHGF